MSLGPTAANLLDDAGRFASVTVEGDPERFAGAPFVACIPAQDEAEHIERCLAALNADLDPGDGVILLANGCRDETVPRARALTHEWSRPFLLVGCEWKQGEGSAPRARAGAMNLAHRLAPGAILFSTDADTIVELGLRAAYGREFAAGMDLVCGAIGFIDAEAALLPQPEAGRDETVRGYRAITARIAALLMPDPHNPLPHHGNIGGANFAIGGEAYRRIGGLPTPPFGEDRALRRRCEAFGLRVRYAAGPVVKTSCRLTGRAPGGLADNLARDRNEADPLVDELFEPPETLLLRLQSRKGFLDGAPTGRVRLLRDLGLDEASAARLAAAGGPAAWQEAEDLSPVLARRPLRLSELGLQLPRLARALARIEEAPSGSPADRSRR